MDGDHHFDRRWANRLVPAGDDVDWPRPTNTLSRMCPAQATDGGESMGLRVVGPPRHVAAVGQVEPPQVPAAVADDDVGCPLESVATVGRRRRSADRLVGQGDRPRLVDDTVAGAGAEGDGAGCAADAGGQEQEGEDPRPAPSGSADRRARRSGVEHGPSFTARRGRAQCLAPPRRPVVSAPRYVVPDGDRLEPHVGNARPIFGLGQGDLDSGPGRPRRSGPAEAGERRRIRTWVPVGAATRSTCRTRPVAAVVGVAEPAGGDAGEDEVEFGRRDVPGVRHPAGQAAHPARQRQDDATREDRGGDRQCRRRRRGGARGGGR